jgi:hypothetical protein
MEAQLVAIFGAVLAVEWKPMVSLVRVVASADSLHTGISNGW